MPPQEMYDALARALAMPEGATREQVYRCVGERFVKECPHVVAMILVPGSKPRMRGFLDKVRETADDAAARKAAEEAAGYELYDEYVKPMVDK